MNPAASPARSAYIHVPFCAHRCGYCNFTLVANRDDLIEAYLAALERELALLETPREVDTLFFGGGTPTHLPPRELDRLLQLVRRWFPPADGAEISVEANPIDAAPARVAVLAEQGVSRLSLGAQAFDAAKLKLLERDHTADMIRAAVDAARPHIPNLSLDLIFGAPGETLAGWRRDLDAALQLAPTHVSTYWLTFEKGTAFWTRREKGVLQPLDENDERTMYELGIDALTAAGFEHYEVSNFARPGFRSRHNQVYWTGGEFYAAGPGAARLLDGVRSVNHRSTTAWIKRLQTGQSPIAESEQLDPDERLRERVVFGLRRLEGVNLDELSQEFNGDVREELRRPLEWSVEHGFLTLDGPQLRLTRAGLLVSDALWSKFL